MSAYSQQHIARELVLTALGESYHGNALRVAKDLPGVSDADRAVLDRWASGGQGALDHIALQEIAMRICSTPELPAAPSNAKRLSDKTAGLVHDLRRTPVALSTVIPHLHELTDELGRVEAQNVLLQSSHALLAQRVLVLEAVAQQARNSLMSLRGLVPIKHPRQAQQAAAAIQAVDGVLGSGAHPGGGAR